MTQDRKIAGRLLDLFRKVREAWLSFSRDLFSIRDGLLVEHRLSLNHATLDRLRQTRDDLKVQIGKLEYQDPSVSNSKQMKIVRQVLTLRFEWDLYEEILIVSQQRIYSVDEAENAFRGFFARLGDVVPYLDTRIAILEDQIEELSEEALEHTFDHKPAAQEAVEGDQVSSAVQVFPSEGIQVATRAADSRDVEHHGKSLEEMPIADLWKRLTLPQAWGIALAIVAVLGGTFHMGRRVERASTPATEAAAEVPARLAFLPADISIDLATLEQSVKPFTVQVRVQSQAGSAAFLRDGTLLGPELDSAYVEYPPDVKLISVNPSKPTIGGGDSATISLELILTPLLPHVSFVTDFQSGEKVLFGRIPVRIFYRERGNDVPADIWIPVYFIRTESRPGGL